jgi:soluble lytic murein transglycosylase-like protein
LILTLVFLLAAPPASPPAPPPYETEIRAAVADVTGIWPVPPLLVRALIRQESAFNPRAVSSAGARGLMQVMPETAAKVGLRAEDLFVPATNILAGVRLLAALLKHYEGDVVSALVAYNSGPRASAVVPNNGETPDYVSRILTYWRQLDPSLSPPPAPPPKRR